VQRIWNGGATMKILVLDDHRGFREAIESILTRHGHDVVGVESAEKAIPLVENGDYDFVLVDYQMPEHDGIWFMQHVQRPRRTKAILATAIVNRQIIDAMFKAGASGYLIKPFDEDDLLMHLRFYSGSGA